MTESEIMRLLYLGLLGLLVGGSLFAMTRSGLSQTLRNAAIWSAIFGVAVLGYSQRDLILADLVPGRALTMSDGTVALTRAANGSFEAVASVNGTEIRFLVDTGASDVVLSLADAERVGLNPDALNFSGRAQTANGTVRIAPVLLDSVQLGGHEDRFVRGSVNSGELNVSLLGMSYLERFERIEIQRNRMLLVR
ncbi:MAG: TIGR02281 family clan AA aspartic protease [Pseudomonadota bacterium]